MENVRKPDENLIHGLDSFSNTMEELRADYEQMVGAYAAAIREINARLQTLNQEFQFHHKHNPIHHIKTRVKSMPSIMKKLRNLGYPVSMTSAKKNLHDIAGVRVICRYVDDIYRVADLLLAQDDISLIQKKDYIQNPKPNGYRSLHAVVDIPVYMSKGKLYVPVEIQIRTVAMDFWATLEHGIRYKATEEVPQEIVEELRECAGVITETDYKMQEIFKKLRMIHDADDAIEDESIKI